MLFVNRIPLAVIECKRPDERDAADVGISQHLRNQRQDEIPGLFVFSQLLGSICQNHGKYATTGTPKKFWSSWKEEHADDLDVKLAKLVNTPLTAEQLARMFENRKPWGVAKMKEVLAAGERLRFWKNYSGRQTSGDAAMSESVERAVASFLGEGEINWEKLKPVVCFVVLWNRLEAQHGQHLNLGMLESSAHSTASSPTFDILRYEPHVAFFQERYRNSPHRLSSLLRTRQEPVVKQRVDDLVSGKLNTTQDILVAVLMVPYRIRNNLFHGRKDTFQLYTQTELFTHVNGVLCLFHSDLNGGS